MHKKLDPSVTHWDDKKRATRMTKKGALAYLVEIAFVIAVFVQSLATNIKKFTK
ncbi:MULTISPECIES: hypothetical protein [unclassified Wolbachia]|uniref:hypothetical protein n=1 Tax=unclassified Wolbachia TaxID=2640676 RepID=UPI00209E8119|nr:MULTISPECIES: hypothetical protein [unclassified Wolbachia]